MRKIAFLLLGTTCSAMIACSSDKATPSGGDATDASTGGSSSGGAGSGGKGGSGGGAGRGSSADAADAGGITISGVAHDWNQMDPFAAPVLAGMKVCLYEHPEVGCSTSAADGTFAVSGVPANSKVVVSFEMSGRLSALRPVVTGANDLAFQAFENGSLPLSKVSDIVPNLAIDSKKGSVIFFITTAGTRFNGGFDWLRGFKVSASPNSGDGPLYTTAAHVVEPAATKSVGGFGLFENMADGDYTLTFEVPAGSTCTAWGALGLPEVYGYPTSDPMKLDVPVVGGFVTGPIGLYCNAPPLPDGGTEGGTPGLDAGHD